MVQTGFGGPEVVRLRHVPDPDPGPDEVVVRVRACAVNRLDILQRRGPALLPAFHLPHIAGTDVAGCVAAVGARVETVAVGDSVVVDPTLGCGSCPRCVAGEGGYCAGVRVIGGNTDGGFAEYVAVPARQLHPVPAHVSLDEAATLPTAWSLAWHATHSVARVQPGECVVVPAAASSISLAAIQLAKRAGARVVAVASTDEKLTVARQVGADLVVRNTRAGFAEPVRGFTGGLGADVVLDHVGADSWQSSLACLRIGGRLVMLGNTSGDLVSLSLADVYHRGLRLLGAGAYTVDDFTAMLDAYCGGGLHSVRAAAYGLEDLPTAYRVLETRATIGKVLVHP